jgi:hypothetical protein
MHGNGLKEIVDIIDDKLMSIIDLLEKKGNNATHQEWNKVMQERIIKILDLLTKNINNFFLVARK